jgi:hypothetical protein
MAELLYNGVTLSYLSTQHVNFEPVMDELAGVDYLYTRVVIVCTAVITPTAPPASSPGETATAVMTRVSHLLNTPRRGLVFTVGGVNLVSVTAPGNQTTVPLRDARNGPYTQANVTRIVGTESILVQFRAETYVVDCPGASGGSPQYVSFRWTEIAEVNELAMTRRTRSGRLEVRADLLANADQLRGLVVPPLEPDMRRLSSRYVLQADGRALAFEFVDEEQYLMPPTPAAKAEGHFALTCQNGAAFWAEVSLRLQADKGTDKTLLMRRCAAVAVAKIQLANPAGDVNGSFILHGTLAENMFENDVSVRLTAQVMPTKSRLTTDSAAASDSQSILRSVVSGISYGAVASGRGTRPDGTKPGISSPGTYDWLKVPAEFFNDGRRFDPGDRGSAALLLVSAALSDPCLRISVDTNTYQQQTIQAQPGKTGPATVTIASAVPDDARSYRTLPDADKDGVYDFYDVMITDDRRESKFALPVGKKDADVVIIQTATPITYRRVEWKASKIGGPPKVPDPKSTDPKWVLLESQTRTGQLEPIADGSIIRYVLGGQYDYVNTSGKSDLTVTLTAAVPPWVDVPAVAPLSLYPFNLVPWILNPLLWGQSGSGSFAAGGPIIPGVNG